MKTAVSVVTLALLAIFVAAPAAAQPPAGRPTTLVILADHHIQRYLWPVLVATLQRDAQAESKAAHITANLRIILSGKNTPGPVFPTRIEAELLGSCDDIWDEDASASFGPLGWVLESSGHISPVIYVDCARIRQAIWPKTRNMTQSGRLRAVSQAISHVILHEWIHIATQSPDHAKWGIMRPVLTPNDLVSPIEIDARFALRTSPASN